jgi:hypothetical protein
MVLEPPKTLFLAVRNCWLHNPKFHSIYVCLYTSMAESYKSGLNSNK